MKEMCSMLSTMLAVISEYWTYFSEGRIILKVGLLMEEISIEV